MTDPKKVPFSKIDGVVVFEDNDGMVVQYDNNDIAQCDRIKFLEKDPEKLDAMFKIIYNLKKEFGCSIGLVMKD